MPTGIYIRKDCSKIVICKQCKKEFKILRHTKNKFCSHKCYGESLRGKIVFIGGHTGKKHTDAYKEYMSRVMTGRTHPKAEKHWNWKGGITGTDKEIHSLNNPRYREWRNGVLKRDNFKCKICGTGEQLEAHHILRWSEFIELRYDINNGITLCRTHHPRRRVEEKRLSPYFRDLVSVSK